MSYNSIPTEEPIPGDVDIRFETNPGAMWSRDRFGYFPNALSKFARMMDADFYAPPQRVEEHPSYHFLNAAALPSPIESVRARAREIFELWSREELPQERKEEILRDARREAANLVNMADERGVALFRNASEALSYFLWLSGVMEYPEEMPLVVSTDVENPSIQREIFVIRDHSNIDRKDSITTYPEFGSQRAMRYEPPQPKGTDLQWGYFQVQRLSDEASLEHLENFIQDSWRPPRVLILSHVLRTTGRVLPLKEWIAKARAWHKQYYPDEPDLFVCVDGAQALGNISVDVADLDCDMYVGCGHKALQGEAVGILYMDPENPRIQAGLERIRALQPDTQVILRGMFHPDLGITPNVDDDISYPDLAGFIANAERLRTAGMLVGNDVSVLSAQRSPLRQRCIEGLESIAAEDGYALTILDREKGTPFILAFRLGQDPFEMAGGWDRMTNPEGIFEPGAMHNTPIPTESWGKDIAKKLDERGVGIAFLRRGNIFRVSFADQTKPADIEAFLREFRSVLLEYPRR